MALFGRSARSAKRPVSFFRKTGKRFVPLFAAAVILSVNIAEPAAAAQHFGDSTGEDICPECEYEETAERFTERISDNGTGNAASAEMKTETGYVQKGAFEHGMLPELPENNGFYAAAGISREDVQSGMESAVPETDTKAPEQESSETDTEVSEAESPETETDVPEPAACDTETDAADPEEHEPETEAADPETCGTETEAPVSDEESPCLYGDEIPAEQTENTDIKGFAEAPAEKEIPDDPDLSSEDMSVFPSEAGSVKDTISILSLPVGGMLGASKGTEMFVMNISSSNGADGQLKLYFEVKINNLTGGSGGDTCSYQLDFAPKLKYNSYRSTSFAGGNGYTPYLLVNQGGNVKVSSGTYTSEYFKNVSSSDNAARFLEFRGTWTLDRESAKVFRDNMTGTDIIRYSIYTMGEDWENPIKDNKAYTVTGLTSCIAKTVCEHNNIRYSYISDSVHQKLCADCGASLGNESHSIDDGECTGCGHVFSVSVRVHFVSGSTGEELIPVKSVTVPAGYQIPAEEVHGYIHGSAYVTAKEGDVYISYTPVSYSILIYDSDHGGMTENIFTYDADAAEPVPPSKAGYELLGYML